MPNVEFAPTIKFRVVVIFCAENGASVLYCKLYKKDNKYIGCGDCTIDTMEGMNMLLNKDTNLKDFTVGSYSGTFFRYNNKKHKPANKSELAK